MSEVIAIAAGADGFAEDKEYARALRTGTILPALDRGDQVRLDFGAVAYATQSFVHVLIAEALKKHGDRALELLEFRHCSPQLRSVVEFVVDYSLSGFAGQNT